MRPGTLLLPFVLLLLPTACGGSSSETPWPAEPSGPALGPDDEADPTDARPPGEEDTAQRSDASR